MENKNTNSEYDSRDESANDHDFQSSIDNEEELESSKIFDIDKEKIEKGGKNDDDVDLDKWDSQSGDEDPDAQEEDEIEETVASDETVELHKSKFIIMKKMVVAMKESAEKLEAMIMNYITDEDESRIKISQLDGYDDDLQDDTLKIIEGVFDGEHMIGPDGKQYSVPPNYASKSKLVEGDLLKLTIAGNGGFIYKQTSPIERIRKVGKLYKDPEGRFFISSDNGKWRVLPASITYFKGDIGDEVVILIPKNGHSLWGAVENIVKNNA